MIHIENRYNEAIIYADTIDSGSEGLIRALCGSPISNGSKIRIMPDVHAGKGCAIGTTMTIHDSIAPGLVGADIGCGITAWKFRRKRLELQKLDKLIHEKIPSGHAVRSSCHRFSSQIDLSQLHCFKHIRHDKALQSVGTLGGGNHFIEVDVGADGGYWLIIHSGSRHLGAEIASFYQKEAYDKTTPEGVPYEFACATGALMYAYLHDMVIAQEFASLNRQAIAADIIKGMKLDVETKIETVHNYINPEDMILRKGAISAKSDEMLMIPMNMRDGCLLCTGKGNPDWNQSAPHGAGRLMSRSQSRESFTLSQFKKEMKGIFSSTVCKETLDESPMAYKPMEEILSQIYPTVDVLEQLQPIYNYKAEEK